MLTPAFELSQDENYVTVLIKTPYVKISEVDFHIDGHEFKFHVKPYFLRLNLPGKIVEDGREGASYDVEKGTFMVVLPKLQQGEFFEGLDMLTTLLAPVKKGKSITPAIEILNELNPENNNNENASNNENEEEFNWEIEQELPKDEVQISDQDKGKYGFGHKKSGVFTNRHEELYELSDAPNPEFTTLRERRLARLAAEDFKFDSEHYLADFFDEETIRPYLDYTAPWNIESKNEDEEKTSIVFTEDEKDKLRKLVNRDYLLDDTEEQSLLLGLVDIIFAFAYNHRTTEGENTVESPWTINKLSSTLCYFETFTNIKDVIVGNFRRCLSYPLYRNWKLTQHVLDDTKKIFGQGKKRLVKCLLEIHSLFNEDDPRYLLNDLYITDYSVWLQKLSGTKIESLAKTLQKVKVIKEDLGWQLEDLEKEAMLVEEQDDESSSSDTSESEDSSSTDSESDNIKITLENLSLDTNGNQEGPRDDEICFHSPKSEQNKNEEVSLTDCSIGSLDNESESKINKGKTTSDEKQEEEQILSFSSTNKEEKRLNETESSEEESNNIEIKIGNLSLTENTDTKDESASKKPQIIVLDSKEF